MRLSLEPGNIMPDFAAFTPDNKKLSLYEVVSKSKITLVDFWASWCVPCRQMTPQLKKMYQKYHDKGFNILSFSIDDKAEKWKKAIEEDQMEWINISDQLGTRSPISRLYSPGKVPTIYLLDKDGKIIVVNLRDEELDKKVEELME